MDDFSNHGRPAEDFFMAALWDAARPAEVAVPGYVILGEISRGGMGVVYHARQVRPEREVALKILLPQFAEEPEMLARFQVEARAMAALDHPGILPVYEVGEADGAPFFSMKLATGGSLSERLQRGPMPPKEAAALIVELARALHHAHQHGVLHRDLKPGNFLFLEDGRACVSDFGLAKLTLGDHGPMLTRTESFFGTPHYMPPEVAAGSVGNATVAGDLYSMGAVLYECLTGKRPHPSKENVAALLRSIADDPVTAPDVLKPELPRDLSVICLKALERKPSDRYASLEDFADDLERWIDGLPIHARPVGPVEAGWRWAVRHPLSAGLLAALFGVSLTGGTMLAVSNHQRGEALADARQKLLRSLIDQARSERLLGSPGHRERALSLLRQASDISKSPEIRDEAAALLARPDLSPEPVILAAPEKTVPDDEEDPVTSWKSSGDRVLTFHRSGAARLWGEGGPPREWLPPDGREITGDFTADGSGLILAETPRGVVIERFGGAPEVLEAPGAMLRFLSVDPRGHRVALAGEEGLRVRDLTAGGASWRWGDAQARCAAAWSADGSFLAAAAGERREVVLLSAADGAVCATVPVTGIPQHVAIAPGGALMAVASDDGVVALCETATGRTWCVLRFAAASLEFPGASLRATGEDGRVREWPLHLPAAFHAWSEPPRVKSDGAVFGMALSPGATHLLTVSNGGVAVWSVAEERQTGFHLLENQRIDVRSAAWWLGDREILLQVPGGLERLAVDGSGRPGTTVRVPRIPGSTVLDVVPDGWLVSVTDEEGGKSCELWPGGDPDRARPAEFPAESAAVGAAGPDGAMATLGNDGAIEVGRPDGQRLRLVLPGDPGVRAMAFSRDGNRLIVLTRLHRVFTWNLTELGGTLDELGL